MRRLWMASLFLLSTWAADPGAKGRYELVPNWPKLPADLSLGAVAGIGVDHLNRVWVFHRHKTKPLLCIDAKSGRLLKAFGEGLIENAHGLSIGPDNNLWLTDLKHQQVLVVSMAGKVLQRWGEQGKAGWDSQHFNLPTMVAFDQQKTVYVGDGYGNSRVAKFTLDGKYLGEFGKPGKGPGEFHIPHSIAIDKKQLIYVADRGNRRVQIFSPQGAYLREWKNDSLGRPWAIVAAPEGGFFVIDGGDLSDDKSATSPRNRLLRVDDQGKVLESWGSFGKEPGNFDGAHDLAIGPDSALYVGEVKDGCRIQKFVRRN